MLTMAQDVKPCGKTHHQDPLLPRHARLDPQTTHLPQLLQTPHADALRREHRAVVRVEMPLLFLSVLRGQVHGDEQDQRQTL